MDERASEKLIVALDYKDMDEISELIELLGEKVSIYKVGLESFLNTGGKIIDYLHEKGKKVFLDLKFHDITNTVKMACEYALGKNVHMFNIHCSNGRKTMEEVAHMVKEKNFKSIIIGVTVLTNLSEVDVYEMFQGRLKIEEVVLNLASMARKSGMDGVVCSPLEAGMIKDREGKGFITVCPGVRPRFMVGEKDDQKRIMTPYEAIRNGADYLVIGRPVTKAENPRKAVMMILEEMSEALDRK